MIDSRNFLRNARKGQSRHRVGPGALRRNGALFRGLRNFWDVADDVSAEKPLGLRAFRAAGVVNDVENACPLWHVERR